MRENFCVCVYVCVCSSVSGFSFYVSSGDSWQEEMYIFKEDRCVIDR